MSPESFKSHPLNYASDVKRNCLSLKIDDKQESRLSAARNKVASGLKTDVEGCAIGFYIV
jgi:hypothetical protein